ncbi:MAG: ArsR family transcriptional regulator, arsenate/arsenite/antimonite-responsive transcriptional [Pseudonocardiales bacterium]|nr:ArsR family transcriptional regulator, arsenate/arsenite/antimonite-responsive transcriptional [Pseudonocardiales bacterium]
MPGPSRAVDESPPEFLRLAGNALRWRLLSELARSDRRVSELTTLLDQPQNVVSYHLGRLRAGGLVSMRRSSADGRDSYYFLDLARCREQLAATGAALHPGLVLTAAPATRSASLARGRRTQRKRVLFLCTGNSARSQIAEAFLRRDSDGRLDVFSAGSHPKPVHPNAVRVMRGYGLDLTGHRSKHVDEFAGMGLDLVITLCDKVREVRSEFRGHPDFVHWSIPDPAAAADGRARQHAFRAVAADLDTRVRFLALAIAAPAPTAPPRKIGDRA